jgi:pimeloyl-ACP methyl ester carboxylesterase
MHVEVNGTVLWFDVDGPAVVPDCLNTRERPTVVLLHGGPGSYDHSYLKPDFGRLSRDAQVVYLDLRAHGRSARDDPANWSFEICADDLRAFCDTLGIVRPVVFGHSMGGFVAMVYAVRHPGHAEALVLQSTNARFDLARLVEGFRAAGGDEVARIAERHYGGDPSVTDDEWERCRVLFGPWVPGEQERARIIRNPDVNTTGMVLLRQFDVLGDLACVDCSTLVCVGEIDPVTPVAAAREIVDALPAGRARLEVVEGAGHFPWRDAPDRYWPLITDFVATTASAPTRI